MVAQSGKISPAKGRRTHPPKKQYFTEIMNKKSATLAELADLVGGEIIGDPEVRIHGLADLDMAGPGEIAFIVKNRRDAEISATRAEAVIVPLSVDQAEKPVIRVKDPNVAAAIIHNHFLSTPFIASGVHPRAHVGESCRISDLVNIGPMAVLGNRVRIGDRVTIHPGVVIGDEVVIGDDTVLNANVVIYARTVIGARVIIHSGTVIGSDGFGYATTQQGTHIKRPHVGIVRIDDDVEIGANTTIDRGTFGETWIKRGTKIDNLVQIGHNVVIGENSLLVAQVGIAGSAVLGRNVVLGGQVGVKGHILLEDGAMVAAKSGVHAGLKKGEVVAGIPAIPIRQWLKASPVFASLPTMIREMREMKKGLAPPEDPEKKE